MLSAIGEIRRDDGCFDFAGKDVVIYPCHGQRGNQEWQYTPVGNLSNFVSEKISVELIYGNKVTNFMNEFLIEKCTERFQFIHVTQS